MGNPVMTELQKDAYTEAGNIAAGYAASALAKLISERVMIDLTKCNSIEIKDIPKILGDKGQFVVGINMLIPTRELCSYLMLIPYQTALNYCDIFTKKELGTTKKVSYREFVILTEIGTICLCAYLNALAKLLNEEYMPTPPAVACDAIGSILEDVMPSIDSTEKHTIYINTEFTHGNGEDTGHFLFIPDQECKESILRSFNIN